MSLPLYVGVVAESPDERPPCPLVRAGLPGLGGEVTCPWGLRTGLVTSTPASAAAEAKAARSIPIDDTTGKAEAAELGMSNNLGLELPLVSSEAFIRLAMTLAGSEAADFWL